MGSITDFDCYFNGKKLPTDAFGNNAAFACIKCSYPVLLVLSKVIKRGVFQEKPAVCRKCGQKYWQESIIEEEKKIILQSKG